MAIPFKQLRGQATPAQIDLSTASNPAHPASRQFVLDEITKAINQRGAKDPVRVATTSAITLSGTQTIDGISVVAGNRVLVKDQGTASTNGIYIVAAGSWTRATDYDETAEIIAGHLVPVQEGSTNGDKVFMLTSNAPITLGTTSLTYGLFSIAYYATPTTSNKNMAAVVTVNDNDVACNTGITATPAQNSMVNAKVNGVSIKLGNGVKTSCDGYFSGDGGTTARALNAVTVGDKLYWVGSVAGFQLDTADVIDFYFVI